MNQRTLQLVEFLYWVLGASLSVIAVAGAIALATGGTLVTVKVVLFVIGVLLFGVGTIGVRPAPAAPHKSKSMSLEGSSQTRFESWLQSLPPLNTTPLRFADRVGRSWKILVTSLVVLGVSAFLEFRLGIAVSTV
ncbi:DUF7555 family protein [Halobacterium wangiae]|uniref:DUF7555 family protein n=1 Tax=Halobacterium wangiae TaxID=2902623 RepID=UPI003D78D655